MHFGKTILILLSLPTLSLAHPADTVQKFSYHFQQTLVGQSAFSDSLSPLQKASRNAFYDPQMKMSMSSTFYLGVKLAKNMGLYINPDIAGGSGLGGTLGVAGYMNGEIFRVGNPAPSVYVSRLFIRKYFPLTDSTSYVASDANQLGEYVPDKRIQLTIGKITLADAFDNNHYSHDPRTRFLNWSLMNAGAYDFASNTKGYTYGIVTEYISPFISGRFGIGIEPQYSNGPITTKRDFNDVPLLDLEVAIPNQGYSLNAELEKPFKLKSGKNGVIRVLGFINRVRAGKYTDAMASPYYGAMPDSFVDNGSVALASVRKFNAIKYGFSLNLEQPIGKHAGAFSRISWNDGKTESFAFAEIDRSESLGFVLHGGAFKRYHDRVEAAIVFNQVSSEHKDYLVNGGYGFMLGEKGMKYASEAIIEFQYIYDLGKDFNVSPDFQIIMNPGYDAHRGPVSVFGVRTHVSL